MISYPNISPEIFSFEVPGIGIIALRWYAVMYLLGYMIGFKIFKKRADKGLLNLSYQDLESYISYLIVGMLLGARTFYVLFYNLDYYKENLSEILFVHHGGLSFHGAVVGMVIASFIFGKKKGVHFYALGDTLGYACTPGLFLGRIGNFINAELYGRPSSAPWAMVFPTDSLALPRHPSQLYQGLTEGLLLFLFIRYYEAKKIKSKTLRRGEVGGIFLVGYAILRFLIEYTRQPDEQLGLVLASLSMGQILCLVMGAIGVVILIHSHKTQPYYKTRS